MNAVRLRLVLIGVIILQIAVVIAGMWLLTDFLQREVAVTDHAKIDADISEQEINTLKRLRTQLADEKDIIERAKQIAASSNQYQYQDQVISDLTVYASRYGFSIVSFDFTGTPGAKGATAPNGKTAFLVTLSSPIKYDNFLKFIRDVERNLTKIRITSITLAPNPRNPTEILNPSINLEVYLKK